MDQIQNGQLPEFLKHLLANPAAANQTYQQQLEVLVQNYPQSSIFHLLLAKAAQNGEAAFAAKTLQTAAVHAANREVLFKLIHQPELIKLPKKQNLYPFDQSSEEAATLKPNASFIDEKSETIADEVIFLEEVSPAENLPKETIDAFFKEENFVSEQAFPQGEDMHSSINLNPEEAIAAENDLRVEDVSLTFVNEAAEEIVFPMEEVVTQQQQAEEIIDIPEVQPIPANTYFKQEIDEEVFEEITAIEDIRIEPVKPPVVSEETATTVTTEPENTAKETAPTTAELEKPTEERPVLTVQDEAEKDMLSSIASIDYFTFNNKFGQNQTPVTEEIQKQDIEYQADTSAIKELAAKSEESSAEKETERVTKYHDEKMPYTFMWWLDKTRKEYAGTYQPYIKYVPAQKTESGLSVGPELHQQYIESIFHTKPPHGLEDSSLTPALETPEKRKEDHLIERFIIQEPHIQPPSSEKLDTENKAKKSSEDADELVTETLAKIYLDQMLYHKALDTYKKLVLKFPEKSRYFTEEIDLIEKKIN